ncbi:MAG TPA: ATPase, T2SS/T4P/T4SS family [Polyangia bacterium]|jgi:general secretion pathway protein E
MQAPVELTLDTLCQILVQAGLLTEVQRREAVVHEGRERGRILRQRGVTAGARRLGAGGGTDDDTVHPAEIVAALGFGVGGDAARPLTEDAVMQAVAARVGLPYRTIDPLAIDAKLCVETLSRPFARRHSALPLGLEDGALTIAIANPFDAEMLDNLQRFVRHKVRPVVATKSDIQRIITEVYGFRSSISAAEREFTTGVDLGNLEQYVRLKRIEEIEANDSHVVNAVEYLLHYALDQRASDIHIEPKREHSLVRLRIDGVLHTVNTLPKVVHPAVVSRLKMLARMDIAEKRRPQDGRIKTSRADTEVELRMSTLPVAFGEKVVIRIFDPEVIIRDLSEIGLSEGQLRQFEGFIARPNGLILVTGPTGSGKTTTLYSALRALAAPDINITTIEDPIEIVVEDFNQLAIQPKIGVDFATALRHILRQDPDVIMVGEIRDAETAGHAVQAALTGHLVLSTLHTNDTATSVTRLVELGVDPFLVSSTLVGVVAQRLCRLVCSGCRAETTLTPDQLSLLGIDLGELSAQGETPQLVVARGEGCPKCRSTGLFGRTGAFEVLEIDDKVRKLIRTGADAKEIMKQARQDGMMTLREAAIRKLAKGLTSFEEVTRVTVEG